MNEHIDGRRRRLASAVAAVGLTIGLATATGSPAEAHDRRVSVDHTTVFEIGDEDAVTGRSTLLRSERGILGLIRTGGLVPGDAYTVWAVVFNNPDGCVDGCDAADLANPDAEAVSMLGAGRVSRSQRSMFVVAVSAGAELTDPHGAEIHFVVRTHGPAIPGLVEEQISTLDGGCPPNACANVVMAKHE